jgi:hypothetical protein
MIRQSTSGAGSLAEASSATRRDRKHGNIDKLAVEPTTASNEE